MALNARGELDGTPYFLPGPYTVLLKRADGTTVWSRRVVPGDDGAALVMTNLAADGGSALIGFDASDVGNPGTAQDHMRRQAFVTDFPFMADSSGLTDTTAAVAAAFAAGVTRFPAGTFVISSNLVLPEAAWNSVIGAGKGRTILKFTSGGLVAPITGFKNYHAFNISGLSILTTTHTTSTVGLRIYSSNPSGGEYTVSLSDLEIGGWSGVHGDGSNPLGPNDWWDICLQLDGVRFVHWDDVMIYGGDPGQTAAGIDIVAPTDSSNPGFHYTGDNFSIVACTKGVRVNGWVEGIYIDKFEIFACRDAFTGNHAGTGALVVGTWFFSNGHMNASRDCFTANGINNIGFVNVSLNRGVVENVGPPHYAGDLIRIENAGPDGEIVIADSRMFNAFTDQGSFIAITNCERVLINNISCYGGSSTNLIALGGATDNVIIDNVFCQTPVATVLQLGGNTGAGNIQYGNMIVPTYTSFRADTGGKMGKYISTFAAFLTAAQANVTGDGTFATMAAWTPTINDGAIFNETTGLVTTKVQGWYEFDLIAEFTGLGAGHTEGHVILTLSPGGNQQSYANAFAMSTGGACMMSVHAEAYLGIGATISPTVMVNGSTKTVGLGGGSIAGSRFSGRLLKQG